MPSLLYVMLGGAVGAGFRYQVSAIALRNLGPGFPWGTWIINLLGGLLMGILAGVLARQFAPEQGEPLRLLLGVGVLGGFTTFSAFSLDALTLWQRGQGGLAALYVAGSVLLSLAAIALGFAAARLA